jgi:hypothetical protein
VSDLVSKHLERFVIVILFSFQWNGWKGFGGFLKRRSMDKTRATVLQRSKGFFALTHEYTVVLPGSLPYSILLTFIFCSFGLY